METRIYLNAILRLKSAEATAAFANAVTADTTGVTADSTEIAGQPEPKHYAWFEGQPDETLSDKNNTYPFNCPAIFFQFEQSTYEKGNGLTQKGEGKLILHVVQLKTADGIEGAETSAEFLKLTQYSDIIIDLLSGYPMPCSAKLFFTSIEKDHSNRSLMVDKITFQWNGTRRRALIP